MIAIGSSFKNRSSHSSTSICGFVSREECFSVNRMIIDGINDPVSFKCSVSNFYFRNQYNGWTLNNKSLDYLLLFTDGLHLDKERNLELEKYILKATNFTINGSKITQYYKNAVCSTDFNLNQKISSHYLVSYMFVIPPTMLIKPVLVNLFLKLLALVLFVHVNPLVIAK